MSWQPIDFQGIISFDHKILEQLELFLQEKENRLAHQILNIIPSSEESSILVSASEVPVKLSEAVEVFSKKVRLSVKRGLDYQTDRQYIHSSPDELVKGVNALLWEFTEVLEGCSVELFQQIRQVPIDRWHLSISYVVQAIKDVLVHHIDDLIWMIRRLERPLKEYCQKFSFKKDRGWRLWLFGKSYLDLNLLNNLVQTENFLKDQ
jgi:hypothetical protein